MPVLRIQPWKGLAVSSGTTIDELTEKVDRTEPIENNQSPATPFDFLVYGRIRSLTIPLHIGDRRVPRPLDELDQNISWDVRWSQNTFEYDPDADEVEDLYGSGLFPALDIEGSRRD
jgi:hypothetical protein